MLDFSCFNNLFPHTIRTIALVAPASPAANPQLLDQTLEALSQCRIHVKLMPHARLGEPGDAYSAIDANLRAQDLQDAWLDPDVQLILPIRGGGGGRELIEALDWNLLRQQPDMPVCGFSDLTLLHAAMLKHHCGRPITSPTLLDFPLVTADSRRSFTFNIAGEPLPDYRLRVLRPGKATGRVFAAHLQRLASLIHTPFMPDLKGRILFLECPHRQEQQLRDIFHGLVQAQTLNQIQALVLGDFPDCSSPMAEVQLLRDMAGQLTCPVVAGFPFGHTERLHTLDSYADATLNEQGLLTIHPASIL